MSSDAPMMVHRLHAIVRGRVQGVGFRYYVFESARRHRLTGWVRNLPDGRVEILAEGPEETLTELLTDINRGPILSHVEDIQLDWRDAPQEFAKFDILR